MKAFFLIQSVLTFFMITAAEAQTSPCSYSCSASCRSYAEALKAELTVINDLCGGGGYPPPPPRASVELYKSDSCSSELMGVIGSGTNCNQFRGRSVWGVKVNGTCQNITDVDGLIACEAFRAAGDPGAAKLYHSDSCSSELIGYAGHSTNCSALKGVSAWGVEINGVCQNISDVDASVACEAMRAAGDPNAVQLYHSDSCSNELIATVNSRTDCSVFATAPTTWGVKINGQCQNISDMPTVQACESFKGAARGR